MHELVIEPGLAFLAALGPGLFLAALTVKFRDFRYVVPFIAQFGLFISPVGFSSDVIPERWRAAYTESASRRLRLAGRRESRWPTGFDGRN
jgi:hypothetical protein